MVHPMSIATSTMGRRRARALLQHLRRMAARLTRRGGQTYLAGLMAQSAHDGLVVQSLDGIILWANPAYCRMMRLPTDRIVGVNPLRFCLPAGEEMTPQQIAAFRYDPRDPEFTHMHLRRNRRGDGTEFWNQMSHAFHVTPGGDELAMIICRDVSDAVAREDELRETSARLAHTASHDSLTGIRNRRAMMDDCRRALDEAGCTDLVGLLHLDIDQFKDINDTKGHAAGDAVLIRVARSLEAAARRDDIVARIGGDEFVVVCPAIRSAEDLYDVAAAILRGCETPFDWTSHRITCRVSIGAALSTPGQTDPDLLLQRADFALYEAKRTQDGRFAIYDETLRRAQNDRAVMSADLREAVCSRALEFHVQPLLAGPPDRIVGFEMLVRWRHPTDGLLAPAVFLDLAESLGLMADIDIAAMESGVALQAALTAAGHKHIGISVNVSSDGLMHPDYVDRLVAATRTHGVDPGLITIEVLETIMFDTRRSIRPPADVIGQLRGMGFRTTLDDFGIGHAGLAHLAQLDLTGVKVDRSLVARVCADRASARIVATVIELCTDLGLDVVGEGVEDRGTAQSLSQMGCRIIQGYGIARPMPQADVIGWLDARSDTLPFMTSPAPPRAVGHV